MFLDDFVVQGRIFFLFQFGLAKRKTESQKKENTGKKKRELKY